LTNVSWFVGNNFGIHNQVE